MMKGRDISFLQYNNWTTHINIDYGLCHTFSAPSNIRSLSIENIVFSLKTDTALFYHHEGHFSRTDGKRQKIIKLVGENVDIDLVYDVSKFGSINICWLIPLISQYFLKRTIDLHVKKIILHLFSLSSKFQIPMRILRVRFTRTPLMIVVSKSLLKKE